MMGQKTQATMRKDSGHTMQPGRQRVSDEKHFGRVYTPRWVVDHMLRPLRQTKMERLTIADPACGVGDFLIPVAEALCARIMAATPRRAAGLRDTLSRLTGYDVDSVAVDECQRRLTETVGKHLGETAANSDWNVHVADAIDASAEAQDTCDWVVGNPPYVRIQHLESDRRAKIQQGGWGVLSWCQRFIYCVLRTRHAPAETGWTTQVHLPQWLGAQCGRQVNAGAD